MAKKRKLKIINSIENKRILTHLIETKEIKIEETKEYIIITIIKKD